MKNSAILLVAMFSLSYANAQKVSEKEVPTEVKTTLEKTFPNTKELKWEIENGNYEAEFEVDELDYSLLIDVSGNILETESEIKIDELPSKAKDYVAKNYSGQKIKEVAKIIDSKGIVTFEVEVKGKDLIFDSKGNFINIKTKRKKDND